MLYTHLSSEACPVGPFEAQYAVFQSYSTSVGVMKWCIGLNVAKVMEHECTNIALYQYHCYTESVMEKNLSFDVKIGNNRSEYYYMLHGPDYVVFLFNAFIVDGISWTGLKQ